MTKITNFVWNPVDDCVISELDGGGSVQAVYTNEPQQYGGVISQRRGTATSTYHADALGTTRALTDSTGNVTDTYLNDTWGNSVAATGTTVNPFKWVGKYGYYTDNSTAQVYVRARMYQPTVARWCSVDPLFFGKANFKYSGNAPCLRLDPSGLAWRKVEGQEHVYEAEGDEDSLYGLAFQLTQNTRDWVCIWPIHHRTRWSSYPWAQRCARADASNLFYKGAEPYGHFLKMVAPPVNGENGYLDALRFLFRTDAYVWSKGANAGEDAATRFKNESGQGNLPINLLLIAGHGYRDDKICSGHPQKQVNCFSASDVFAVADEKFNDRNSYDHARRRIGPPRCWLTRTSVVYGVACNTSSVWAPEWASRIARPNSTVKGAPSVINAQYDSAGNASAWFTEFEKDRYNTAQAFLESKHWVDFPGGA